MPRFPRNYIKTSFYHVMTQGINKDFIFDHPSDIKYYISLMYKLKQEHDINIISYCIMNNHAHILIQTDNLNDLSKYMQRINTKYGIYYNKKNHRVGHVFRNRYKSEGIYSEEQLYCCINYIYNNPVKAGICNHPSDYPYSNYKKTSHEYTDDYIFMDIDDNKDKICKNIIDTFLLEHNMDLTKLKNDKLKLRDLLIILKNDYNISLRKISQILDINRETLRNIYKY